MEDRYYIPLRLTFFLQCYQCGLSFHPKVSTSTETRALQSRVLQTTRTVKRLSKPTCATSTSRGQGNLYPRRLFGNYLLHSQASEESGPLSACPRKTFCRTHAVQLRGTPASIGLIFIARPTHVATFTFSPGV